jgi:glutamine amidotransferase
LYYSTKAGVTLNRKYPDHPDGNASEKSVIRQAEEHGKHVIVASEPNTYKGDDWQLVPANSFVLVDEQLNITIEDVVL